MKLPIAAVIVLSRILLDGPSSTSPSFVDALSLGGGISPAIVAGTLPRGGARIRIAGNRRAHAGANDAASSTSAAAPDDGDDDGDARTPTEDDDGKSTISSAAFNLIKGAVGSGVLSLPAGVAAYGDVRRA